VGWFCRGLWVSLCFWVFRVFFLSPLALLFWFPLCILLVCLGAPFTLFIKFSTYLSKKKDAVIKATGSKASELAGSDFDDL
jgi:hypothetical protein